MEESKSLNQPRAIAKAASANLTSKEKKDQFNERYMGLTRREVALREQMARKFGGQASHLAVRKQAALQEEEKKSEEQPTAATKPIKQLPQKESEKLIQEESKQSVSLPIRADKSEKLRQLQEESERYRACIESGHQLMQQPMTEKDLPYFQKSQSEHNKYSLAGQGYK